MIADLNVKVNMTLWKLFNTISPCRSRGGEGGYFQKLSLTEIISGLDLFEIWNMDQRLRLTRQIIKIDDDFTKQVNK